MPLFDILNKQAEGVQNSLENSLLIEVENGVLNNRDNACIEFEFFETAPSIFITVAYC